MLAAPRTREPGAMPSHETKSGWLRPVSETCLRLLAVAAVA